MNVRAAHPTHVPVPRRGLDVTVSDGGVHERPRVAPPVAPTPVAAAPATPATPPTSRADLAASLTPAEQGALSERFATLPRQGVTGVYGPGGRASRLPEAAQNGRLLDITG